MTINMASKEQALAQGLIKTEFARMWFNLKLLAFVWPVATDMFVEVLGNLSRASSKIQSRRSSPRRGCGERSMTLYFSRRWEWSIKQIRYVTGYASLTPSRETQRKLPTSPQFWPVDEKNLGFSGLMNRIFLLIGPARLNGHGPRCGRDARYQELIGNCQAIELPLGNQRWNLSKPLVGLSQRSEVDSNPFVPVDS